MDQVVEQKMSYIQSKVEEILYNYVGIAKPIKKEKLATEALEVETADLLPTDLEQVSPDSDKRSLPDDMEIDESRGEEVEEEIVEDEDFESPAFEPIEAIAIEKNENSNLSAISGLTSQDSIEDKSDLGPQEQQQETQLSQISSIPDISQEASEVPATIEVPENVTTVEDVPITEDVAMTEPVAMTGDAMVEPVAMTEDVEMGEEIAPPLPEEIAPPLPGEIAKEEPEKSNFDLKKDIIEFTGTERKSISLDDSPTNIEPEKALQPQDVPSNTVEIDNLYENDTTDSSTRMEIDLKDETTQGTMESTKVEESSQDSTVSKEKRSPEEKQSDSKKESRHHHHKSDRSRDAHKSSSSSHKSKHHHRSSSSKSHHDDRHKRSDGKSSSSSHKKSSSDKDRSRRDHDKDKKPSRDDASRSKHRSHKTDDHQQEKSSRRRRSTDHDSNEGKGEQMNSSTPTVSTSANAKSDQKVESAITTVAEDSRQQVQETTENKPVKIEKILSESCEISFDSRSPTSSGTKKEQKSSILIKYDYLKSPPKMPKVEKIEDGFCGFPSEDLIKNPWFECLRNASETNATSKACRQSSNNNYLEQKKIQKSLTVANAKSKAKPKVKQTESLAEPVDVSNSQNGIEETSSEVKAQTIVQQQRYTSDDLYKPRFDFGYRSRRRGQVTTEATSDDAQGSKADDVRTEF